METSGARDKQGEREGTNKKASFSTLPVALRAISECFSRAADSSFSFSFLAPSTQATWIQAEKDLRRLSSSQTMPRQLTAYVKIKYTLFKRSNTINLPG